MAVPKRRVSKSRQGMRRSHLHVTAPQIQYCPNCKEPVLPHRVCENCGYYRGAQVMVIKEKKK